MLSIESLIDSPRWLKALMNRSSADESNAFLSEILLGEGDVTHGALDADQFCAVELHYRQTLLRRVFYAWTDAVHYAAAGAGGGGGGGNA